MGAVNIDANIEKLENILGGHLLEQGAYYVEYGIPAWHEGPTAMRWSVIVNTHIISVDHQCTVPNHVLKAVYRIVA